MDAPEKQDSLERWWQEADAWITRRAKHLHLPQELIQVIQILARLIAVTLVILTLGLAVRVLIPMYDCVIVGSCGSETLSGGAFELLKTILLGIGGVATLHFLAKRSKALERTAEANTNTVDKRTEELAMTRRDHLSRRFSDSVKQLGDKQAIETRLGGIAGLLAVAQESTQDAEMRRARDTDSDEHQDRDGDADRQMVLNVLCAFLRTGGRKSKEDRPDPAAWEDVRSAIKGIKPLAVPGETLDLRGAQLSNGQLMGVDFTGLDLSGADLTGATLIGAVITPEQLRSAKSVTSVNLSGVDLSGADLSGLNLYGAILIGADLTGAILTDADLTNANLTKATITVEQLRSAKSLIGIHLNRVKLSGLDLSGLDLTNAILDEAILACCKITSEQLRSAKSLIGIHLNEVNLSGFDLSGLDLTRANLNGTILTGAILDNVNLTGVLHITPEQLRSAKSLEGVKGLPWGLAQG